MRKKGRATKDPAEYVREESSQRQIVHFASKFERQIILFVINALLFY